MVARVSRNPLELPFYFNWSLVFSNGTRLAQYDERGRLCLFSKLDSSILKEVEAVEIYPHPMFVSGAPPTILKTDGKSIRLEYHGRQGVDAPKYGKQQLIVFVGNIKAVFTPGDFESAGRYPEEGYEVSIQEITAPKEAESPLEEES